MIIATSRPKGSVVFAVFLLLALASPQALASNDRMIQQAIEEAAANTPELHATEISVAVQERSVVLSGSVRLYLHRLLYEKIAWQTIGVVEVDNEIRVVPQASLSDAAIERMIWEIVKLHEQFHNSDFKLTVKNGVVSLDGTFGHPLDVIFLRNRVAAIEGVIAIEIKVGFRV